MTNTNNTAAAIAAEIIATAETRIELRAAELHDVDCFRKLCASAVAWLDAEYFGQADDDEEHADEYRDPLSFEVYRNSRTGEYIAGAPLSFTTSIASASCAPLLSHGSTLSTSARPMTMRSTRTSTATRSLLRSTATVAPANTSPTLISP